MRRFLLAALLACLCPAAGMAAADDYAMYVWKTGFDATVPGCDEAKLLAWDKTNDPECYTHNWETSVNRQWLWDTANRPGREIGRLFISDIKPRLESAYTPGEATGCDDPDVTAIKEMLLEGHCEVPGVELYALLSTSDVDVGEKDDVKYIVWYNDFCAISESERFDGVAVNNEAWNDVKCSIAEELAYLDDLQTIADEAALQDAGTLATHYSIGWKWSYCLGSEVTVDWGGTVQPATYHMIDIFDSVDVQVAYVNPGTVADRADIAGYDHAVAEGKPFYVLAYTNKNSTCVTTHFPYDCDEAWTAPTRTDAFVMEDVFDSLPGSVVPDAIGAIHFFRGAYSTGAHPDWPTYYSGTDEPCATVGTTEPGPLVFGAVNELAWGGVANATVYELARHHDPRFGNGCRIMAATPNTTAHDQEVPAPGTAFFYLVRVLAPVTGPWGHGTDGVPRQLQCF